MWENVPQEVLFVADRKVAFSIVEIERVIFIF